ncbi:hypothetical protein [Streptomyces sp. NRRL S-378]|uniref:hypothetical protein n=1 Tax=Streptomyces sp. NRRL S-378 TaxID=1463904 RepID=UPI000D13F78C|nr:hypothetical protein [Streptomyces sp. NRRL S-378]
MLACWFEIDRSTVTRAIGEARPRLAERGRTISPGTSPANARPGHRPPWLQRAERKHRRGRADAVL